jgi:uncharacterized protein (TIGR03435 family)
VRTQPGAARGWQEFSIGPAHGLNTSINPNAIHSDGMTLAVLLSVAYAIPRTRILGPAWLGQDLFAITAVARADDSQSLRELLQQELRNRLGVVAHAEDREFAAYVLTAGEGATHLEPANGRENSNYVHPRDLDSQEATLSDLCNVLQGVLGKPVVDETGIAGRYHFVMTWGDDTERTIMAALDTKFGLALSPARRRLPALVVEHVERGAAVAIFSAMGRMTSPWPVGLRRGVSRALSAH